MGFRKDFVWGTATASYQVEGAVAQDGRGFTVWDDYCERDGRIFDGHDGKTACDHYHRYREDVAMMKKMGQKAYRFSVAWSRIIPDGFGQVNQKGIDFYDRLIDELLLNGIEPYLTLFHWDLPFEIYKRGGWQNPDVVEWYGRYAQVVAEHFGDRVKNMITFNEPQCFIGLGHVTGEHAPGNIMSKRSVLEMAHHVMMAHGKAVQAIRSIYPDIKIGYAPTSSVAMPLDPDRDIKAAKEAYFSLGNERENYMWSVSWFSDPVMLGEYPKEGLDELHRCLPGIKDEDMILISQPIDFYGQNIYNGYYVRAGEDGGYVRQERQPGYAKTGCGWPVTPECLYWGPRFLYERYHTPVIITENGMSCHDTVSMDGSIHDTDRIDFLHRYLCQLKRAAEEGIDVRGYFAWSLMDNFEWSQGYSQRFGLAYVDYKTQQRILKDSAYWYAATIKENGENL